jgi:predicted MFS family arabinose efflux permease
LDSDHSQPARPPRHRTYVLTILTLVYVVSYLDRQILAILMPMIKAEFHLSDTALGLLSGTSFAVIYATGGITLAWFADRMNRRNIIAGSLAVFSLMTVACSFAAQFWQLVLARVGTGIGEAGTAPSINSMISDLYPPSERATALSIYSAGLNVGLLLAFFGGGWTAQHYGWRDAFMLAGLPGLILVFFVLLTLDEPKRGAVDGVRDAARMPSLSEVADHLWAQRSFRFIALGVGLSAFGGYAGIAWIPSFLSRSHQLTPLEIGMALATATGVFGFFGTLFSGVIADRLAKRDIRWNMLVPFYGQLAVIPFAPIFYLVPGTALCLAAGVVPAFLGAAYLGPSFAMTQGLVPLRMRATAAALLLFVVNMIGLGLGPQFIGIVSDLLKPAFGADSLRYALLTTMISGSAAAWCYWQSTKSLKADLARAVAMT